MQRDDAVHGAVRMPPAAHRRNGTMVPRARG
jgi:hypothetical protein